MPAPSCVYADHVTPSVEVRVWKVMLVPAGVWFCVVSRPQGALAPASLTADVYVPLAVAYDSTRAQSTLSVPLDELLDKYKNIAPEIATG